MRIILILAFLFATTGCSLFGTAPGILNGSIIPTAERIAIEQIAGEDLLNPNTKRSTGDHAGDVIVVNVWGSWCGPCRSETPEIEQAYQQTRGTTVDFLGINIRDHVRSYAEDFTKDRSVSYPSICDPSARSLLKFGKYRNIAVPTTFILDRRHRVAVVFIGAVHINDLIPRIMEVSAE
ncbi:MAG: TlpA disulfide reductase family protein [Pseudonocardiaceae bacterium]